MNKIGQLFVKLYFHLNFDTFLLHHTLILLFEIYFSLDQESGMPRGYKLYEHRHSNKLIEEYMLLANISVATKIQQIFPNIALLRCHPEPKMTLLDKFVDQLRKYGMLIYLSFY